MKKWKIFLPVLLILALSLVFSVAAEGNADTMTVYVDQSAGVDTNDGASEATAVKTLDRAYALLDEGLSTSGTGTIVLVSDYTFSFSANKAKIATSIDSHSFQVVITGKTAQTALLLKNSVQSYLQLLGPTKFEAVTVRIHTGSYKFISIHGAGVGGSFIIGDRVTTSATADERPTLMAAPYANANAQANEGKPLYLQINSGDWRNVYASGYTNDTVGEATLVFNGGTAAKLAVQYMKTHTGTVAMHLNGGTVNILCPVAANATGTVKGDITITYGGTTVAEISYVGEQSTGSTYQNLAGSELTLAGGEHTLHNLTGGSLVLDPSASVTVTGAVTGTIPVSFTATPATGVVYLTAPETVADNAFAFTGTQVSVTTENGVKTWTSAGEYVYKGLVLTVPYSASNPYKVTLCKGIAGTTQVEPDRIENDTESGLTKYYFDDLPAGNYNTSVSRNGYYTVKKVRPFTADQAATETVWDVSTTKRAYKDGQLDAWQTVTIKEFSDGMMNNVLVSNSQAKWWDTYAPYLNTPVFGEGRAWHQATTQEEMKTYLETLDDDTDNMYVYSMGLSGEYGLDLPIVIFTKTDLSGAETLEDAAALVTENGKVTVHYHAQIHGNEPAGGEAALAMIGKLDTAEGDKLLDTINIYVIPRLNPDGSKDYTRAVPSGINANRDMLLAQTTEVQLHHWVYNLFKPEVSIDSHEYTVDIENNNMAYKDMMVAGGYNGNSSEAFGNYSKMLATLPKDALQANGLEFSYYTDVINNSYGATGNMYKGMRGTISILLESRGIGFGNHTMERRVTAHLISVDTILNYVAQNHEEVQAVSDAERERIAENGNTYETDDVIVVKHKTVSVDSLAHTTVRYDYVNGVATGTISVTPVEYVADTTRPRPTAYVLPAEQSWTQQVLELMDLHNISYYYVEPGTAISLQQYTGTVESASLTDERAVTFVSGAYVLPMNQPEATVLALLLEPDLADEYSPDSGNGTAADSGTLAQVGIIPATDDTFPIYRYIHDLNEDGTVETTESEYKVYIHSQNGSDTNDAYSEAAPAKTIEHAFDQLDALMTFAPEGTSGTVVFLDMYTLGSDTTAYTFPSHDYPVVLTSKTGNEGLKKGGTSTQYRYFAFGGDTTLENITIQPATVSTFFYIFANGHSLTVKEDVTTLPGSTTVNNYFNISPGRYSGTYTGNASLTVLGGTWQHLYMGGYTGSVVGNVQIVIQNATFTGIAQNAYNGTTTGNIFLYMENTTFGENGALYAGNANSKDVNGDVTVILGENVNIPEIYAGSRDAGNVTGTVTIIADGADLTDTQLFGTAKNATGTVGKSVLALRNGKVKAASGFTEIWVDTALGGSVYVEEMLPVTKLVGGGSLSGAVQLAASAETENLTVSDTLYLDLNGHDLSGLVIEGTVYAMDSTTDGYSDAQIGKLVCTGAPVADWTAANGNRYVAISDEDGYSFHRISVRITKLTLKPSSVGFGYKAEFLADATVQALVADQSYSLWLAEGRVVTRSVSGFRESVTLRLENFDVENFGETKVNAKVFLTLTDGTVIASDTVSYSMQDMVELIDTKLADLSKEQILAVKALVAAYATTSDWKIPNLLSWNA